MCLLTSKKLLIIHTLHLQVNKFTSLDMSIWCIKWTEQIYHYRKLKFQIENNISSESRDWCIFEAF